MAVPLSWKPERGTVHSYERLREQARIQIQGREAKTILYEALPRKPGFALPRKPGFGLSCLPTPSAGDVFFDIEGDPFVGEHGLEYLFGYCFSDHTGEMRYVGEWALSREEEKAVFEHFIDFVIERLAAFPDLHVYHYAPYEPAALKHLTLRYGTRGDELDQMLRTHLFVDLYSVVKNGIRASVESYSIKRLEPLYDYIRAMDLSNANSALANLQAALELNDLDRITKENKDVVKAYNRDDCLSTHGLRNWLERVRTKLIEGGESIDRPVPDSGAPSERVTEWTIRINDIIRRIREIFRSIRNCDRRNSSLDGYWLMFLIGIGAKRKQRGGNTFGCAIVRQKNCLRSRPHFRVLSSWKMLKESLGRRSTVIGIRLRKQSFEAASR